MVVGDNEAAILYLTYIYQTKQQLPGKRSNFRKSLYGKVQPRKKELIPAILTTTGSEQLVEWAQHVLKTVKGDPIIIINLLCDALVALNCLTISSSKKKFSWNVEKVIALVEADHTCTNNPGSPSTTVVPASSNSSDSIGSGSGMKHIRLIETVNHLAKLKLEYPFNNVNSITGEEKCVVAVDCEGVPEDLFLVQIAIKKDIVLVFDCVKLGASLVCEFLAGFLCDDKITKLFHDVHNDALGFAKYYPQSNDGAQTLIKGAFDAETV